MTSDESEGKERFQVSGVRAKEHGAESIARGVGGK
jgi:hypothetical protein